MKKNFKKSLLAIALIAGFAFAAPQEVNAKFKGSVTYKEKDCTIVISKYDDGEWIYIFYDDGRCEAGWDGADGVRYFRGW